MRTGFIRLAIAATALPMLSGCVVALVPLAASGALLGNEALDNDENGEVVAEVTVRDAENFVETAEVVSPPSQSAPELAASIPTEPAVQAAAEPVELAAIDTKLSTSGTLIGPVDDEPSQQMAAAPAETPAPATQTPELQIAGEPQPQMVATPAEALPPANSHARSSNERLFVGHGSTIGGGRGNRNSPTSGNSRNRACPCRAASGNGCVVRILC